MAIFEVWPDNPGYRYEYLKGNPGPIVPQIATKCRASIACLVAIGLAGKIKINLSKFQVNVEPIESFQAPIT